MGETLSREAATSSSSSLSVGSGDTGYGMHTAPNISSAHLIAAGNSISSSSEGAVSDGMLAPSLLSSSSSSRLLEAVQRGQIDLVQKFLKKTKRINKKDERGDTALHAAARIGHLEILVSLLRKGADIFAENEDRLTPFQVAVLHGRIECAKALADEQPRLILQPFLTNPLQFEYSLSRRFGKLTWTIHSFGKMDEKKVYSEPFWVGGWRWRLVAYPRGSRSDDNLSVYVEVFPPIGGTGASLESLNEPSWSCLASFSFAIVNQLTGERTICREVLAHRFDRTHVDLGFPHIVRKHLLFDRKMGFVHKDRLTIEFSIRVLDTTYATYPIEGNCGSFSWRVPSLTSPAVREQRVTSPLFRIGGCNWMLALYPKGKNVASGLPSGGNAPSSSSHYVSIYLKAVPDSHLADANWYYLVNFRVSLINQLDGSRFSRQVEHKVFRKGVEDWGFPLFMKLNRIFAPDSPFLLDGSISIHVEVDVFESHESTPGNVLPDFPPAIGWTPLLWAAYHGNIEGVRELLVRLQQQGVEWEQQRDNRGRSALDWASFCGHTSLVQYLCDTAVPDAFISRDSEGYLPLHKAVVNGHWDTVAVLLPYYSLFDVRAPTPTWRFQSIKPIDTDASEPSVKPQDGGSEAIAPLSSLHTAVRCVASQSVFPNLEIWGHLLSFDSSVGGLAAPDNDGRLVIHSISSCGAHSVIEYLLSSGHCTASDLNLRDATGATPLHLAIARGNYGLVKTLLTSGADPLVPWTSRARQTAPLIAVEMNDLRMLQLILQIGPLDGHDTTSESDPHSYPGFSSQTEVHDDEFVQSSASANLAANFVSSVIESPFSSAESGVPQTKRKRSNSAVGGEGPFDRFANRHSRIISRAAAPLISQTGKRPQEDDYQQFAAEKPRSTLSADSTGTISFSADSLLPEAPQPQPARRRKATSPDPSAVDLGSHTRSKSTDFSLDHIQVSSHSYDGDSAERKSSAPMSPESKSPRKPSKPLVSTESSEDLPSVSASSKRRLSSSSKSNSSAALLNRKKSIGDRTETSSIVSKQDSDPPVAVSTVSPAISNPSASPVQSDRSNDRIRKRARSKSSANAEHFVNQPLHTGKSNSQKRKSDNMIEGSRLVLGKKGIATAHAPTGSTPLPRIRPDPIYSFNDLLNSVDAESNTALHISVAQKNWPITLFLLGKGLSPNIPDIHGKTVLEAAIDSGDLRCIISLLEHGARFVGPSSERVLRLVTQQTDADPEMLMVSSLSSDMRYLINNDSFSDVIIVVEGKRIHAWRGVLCARSEFFRAMFTSPLREAIEQEIELSDVTYDVFMHVVEFIYTDSLQTEKMTVETGASLLSAANRYMLSRLKILAEEWLIPNIADDNVFALFSAADLYGSLVLRKKCVQYIASNANRILNLSDVVNTPSFRRCVIELIQKQLADTVASVHIETAASPTGSLSPRRGSVESVDNG